MLDTAPHHTLPDDDARERSLPGDLRQLKDDAKALARAEIAYQKSRAAFAGRESKGIVTLGILAAAFAFFAAMGLVFGLVLALTPILTAWGATAAVVGVLLAGAALCAYRAARKWRAMTVLLAENRT